MSQPNLGRRKFICLGAAGAAGTFVLNGGPVSKPANTDRTIAKRRLGRTNIDIPLISFGVVRADSQGLCRAAHGNGITLFDTAGGWQNGSNEKMLGNLVKDFPRSSFMIETKIKPSGIGWNGLPSTKTTSEDFLSRFKTSLSRLNLDYVDFLLVHDIRTPELLAYKPILAAVTRIKKEKKARFIGFSTQSNMARIIDTAADSDVWDVILTTYNFRLAGLEDLNLAIRKAADRGKGIMAMRTMAGGGFLDMEKTRPANTSAAIKWAISNPDIHSAVPGMTTLEHLTSSLEILHNPVLNENEKQELAAMGNEPGLFCNDCRQCIDSCKSGLPVPDLMRAYMYAYGYSEPGLAYNLLGDLGTGISPCINCGVCSVKCSAGFKVREKIADVSRLVNIPCEFIT